jgi:hypothetical protein
LICVILQTIFLCKFVNLAHQNPPLTLSDRAEFFITDTLEVGPEVESAVFNLDPSIGIYRVLKNKTLSWPNTFTYFFIKKEESEIFEKAQNYLWHVTTGSCKKMFSPIGQDLIGFFLRRMENQRFSKKHQKPLRKDLKAEIW